MASRQHRRYGLARSGAVTSLLVSGLVLAGCSSSDEPEAQPGQPGVSPTADSRDLPTGTGTASPEATTDPAEACVQSAVSAMTTAEQAGQLVMAGTPLTDADAVVPVVKRNHLGSVFLHGRSSRSAAGLKKEINRIPAMQAGEATIEPLVSIDQEGGNVQSLRGARWGNLPAARKQGEWDPAQLTQETEAWAEDLAKAGITMNLAPVADVVPSGTEDRNPPIGKYGREYGTSSTQVADAVARVTQALQAQNVVATVKHFPGLGRVSLNTDLSANVIDTRTSADDAYLQPFVAGMEAGAGAVMMSSATYDRIDSENRAVFSPTVITELLRGQLGWQGVVMTDDVGAAKAVADVKPGQRAVRFVDAGGDLVLTVEPGLAREMMRALATKGANDADFGDKIEAAATRVLTLKQTAGLLTCSPEAGSTTS
ncbi:glycoside hydrolase family 3 protein [Kineosporia babensis]